MKTNRAFSLTELLVVIAVIGILASLLLTVTGQVWTSAQTVACQHRLEQIGKACQLYATQHKGYEVRAASPGGSENSRWYVAVLPYLSGATEPGLATLRCPMADEREGELVYNPPEPGPDDPEPLPQHLSEDILVILYDKGWGLKPNFTQWIDDLEYDDSRASSWKGWKEADGTAPELTLCYDWMHPSRSTVWRDRLQTALNGLEEERPPTGPIVTYNTPWSADDPRSVMWPGHNKFFMIQCGNQERWDCFYDFEGDPEKPHRGYRSAQYATWWGWNDPTRPRPLPRPGPKPEGTIEGITLANWQTKWSNEVEPLLVRCNDKRYPPHRWTWPHAISFKVRDSYTPTAEDLANYGQVWVVIYWGFEPYDAEGNKVHADDITAYQRFRDEAGGGIFFVLSATQDENVNSAGDSSTLKLPLTDPAVQAKWDQLNQLLSGTGLGLRVDILDKVPATPPHEPNPPGFPNKVSNTIYPYAYQTNQRTYNPRSNSPSTEMFAFPRVSLLAPQFQHTLWKNMGGGYDVYLPPWESGYSGTPTYGQFVMTQGEHAAARGVPRAEPRGFASHAFDIVLDPEHPSPHVYPLMQAENSELLIWSEEGYIDKYNRQIVTQWGMEKIARPNRVHAAVVDTPVGQGGRAVVFGAALAFSESYQGGYNFNNHGGYDSPNHHQYSRVNHDMLQFSRNVADWLKGGIGSPPAPRKKLWEYVGQCHFGYNDRVAVDPETRTQRVKLTATNPGETIRALDYAYFVAAQEGGIGEIAARHGGKANVLFMDGHVGLLTPEEVMNPDRNYWEVRK